MDGGGTGRAQRRDWKRAVTAVPARPCLPDALSDAAARDLREGADSGNGLEDHLQHQQQQQVDAPRASALTVDHGSLFSSDDEGGGRPAGDTNPPTLQGRTLDARLVGLESAVG